MGIKERQDRERQAVRDSILDAARDLFIADGYRHVSIRKIAERIEYSPAAIYSYFPGKDDIFFALAEEGFRRLDAACRSDDEPGSLPPLDEVRRCWWAFHRFSREQPEFFELMFVDRSVPCITEQWQGFALLREILERVEAQIQRAIDAGALPASLDACVTMHVLFGALMGPAVIGLGERLGPGEDADALARDVLETMLAGLATGISPTFVPCEKMHVSAAVEPLPGVGPDEA